MHTWEENGPYPCIGDVVSNEVQHIFLSIHAFVSLGIHHSLAPGAQQVPWVIAAMLIRTEMRKKHTDVDIYQLYSQRQGVSENGISNARSGVEHASWVGSWPRDANAVYSLEISVTLSFCGLFFDKYLRWLLTPNTCEYDSSLQLDHPLPYIFLSSQWSPPISAHNTVSIIGLFPRKCWTGWQDHHGLFSKGYGWAKESELTNKIMVLFVRKWGGINTE